MPSSVYHMCRKQLLLTSHHGKKFSQWLNLHQNWRSARLQFLLNKPACYNRPGQIPDGIYFTSLH